MAWPGEAVVDPAQATLHCAGARYRFRLSPSRGGVVIGLPEGEHCVRPLRWGEQTWLARFSRLGEAALGDALIEMASDAQDPTALSPASRSALVALWAWIDDQAAPARPVAARFDGAALARAALAVHRATGWPSGALDTLPAGEVLAYAAALSDDAAHRPSAPEPATEAGQADRPPPGVTRIAVIPDPARPYPARPEPAGPDPAQVEATMADGSSLPALSAAGTESATAPTARRSAVTQDARPVEPTSAQDAATERARPRFRLMASRSATGAQASPHSPMPTGPSRGEPDARTPAPEAPADGAVPPATAPGALAAPPAAVPGRRPETTEGWPRPTSDASHAAGITRAAPLSRATKTLLPTIDAAPGRSSSMQSAPTAASRPNPAAAAPTLALVARAATGHAWTTETPPITAQALATRAMPDIAADAAAVAAPAPRSGDETATLARLTDAVADRIEARLREAGLDLGLDMEG